MRGDFPPLRSLGNPTLPNNLPAQLSAFIGRDRETSEVRALVESCRLVTLTGAGGCREDQIGPAGGRRTAGRIRRRRLVGGAGRGRRARTRWPPAICQALGIGDQPGRPVLDALLDALALQDVLIVLDNCEHLIGACAKTADAILRRCPQVHLLATSREPLGIGGETIYRVPSLSLPGPGDSDAAAAGSCDAVALFAERARAQGTGLPVDEQTAPLVVSICARLDGLPLAIELAAARLRSLSLAAFATAWTSASGCSPGAAAPPWRGSRRCGRPSTGPIRCSTAPSRCCCGACGVRRELRPGRRRSGLRRRRHRGVRRHRPARLAGGQEPGRGRAGRASPALPAAGDDPPVRRRAPGRGG